MDEGRFVEAHPRVRLHVLEEVDGEELELRAVVPAVEDAILEEVCSRHRLLQLAHALERRVLFLVVALVGLAVIGLVRGAGGVRRGGRELGRGVGEAVLRGEAPTAR